MSLDITHMINVCFIQNIKHINPMSEGRGVANSLSLRIET